MEHFPALLSREQSDAMADRIQALIEERGWGFWAAEHLASGEFMGFIGLHAPAASLPFSPCVEIGWRLARPFWGPGLASEGPWAAQALPVSPDTGPRAAAASHGRSMNAPERAYWAPPPKAFIRIST